MIEGLVYLASPYSHEDAHVRAWRFHWAAEYAAKLMRDGWMVFSPIAHTHPIAEFGLPKGWVFWEKFDRLFLDACSGLVVLKLPGWEKSTGIKAEIEYMTDTGKPIEYHEPY